LIKCLHRYGISFAVVNPSTELQRQMPLWHHPGEDDSKRQENNGKAARCLRANHTAVTIGDALDLASRLTDPLHSNQNICECDACEENRAAHGCQNPHTCATTAASRLRQIHARWVP
ncbi:hypothetical protein GGX14DRAFT_302499, partial [Mycena pura]